MNINTQIMFATPIGITTLPQELCDIFKPLKGQVQTNASTDPIYFDVLKDFPELKKEITNVFTKWVNNTYNYPDQKWKMLTNWITDNPDGTPMRLHRHYNCSFSAVLYFDAIKNGEGNLILENPVDNSDFFPQNSHSTIFGNTEYTCPLFERLLIFFPSKIYHMYLGYKPSKKLRRSFACNFAPIGKYGSADSYIDTNWLHHD